MSTVIKSATSSNSVLTGDNRDEKKRPTKCSSYKQFGLYLQTKARGCECKLYALGCITGKKTIPLFMHENVHHCRPNYEREQTLYIVSCDRS
mmetsp:Transcript_22146/g.58705  ORF Transcript_22146/g.58705 Transcript_22146/m.58705 type:complete len:92 (+) Transcript_22146:314-589(+)